MRTSQSRALAFLLVLMFSVTMPALPATAQADVVQIGCADDGSDELALRLAIRAANADPDADTIALSLGCTYSFAVADIVQLATALPVVAAPLTIEGNGATILRSKADGVPVFRLFIATSDLTLRDLTLENGAARTGEDGGAVLARASATLRLEGVTASGNSARDGGAIFAAGPLVAERSAFIGNSALRSGGASYARGKTTVTASEFSQNWADSHGGALFVEGASLSLERSRLRQNTATVGGALFTSSGALLVDSALSTNVARAYGGGIYSTAPLTISNSVMISNNAVEDGTHPRPEGQARGGAIYAGDSLTIERSQLVRNAADRGAGAIVLLSSRSGPSQIANSLLAHNSAAAPDENVSMCLFCSGVTGEATLVYTTITAPPGSGQVGLQVGRGTVRVESSILTGFQTAVQRTGDGTLTIRNNLLYLNDVNQQGVIDAGGQISGQDPRFADLERGDYRLLSGSPALGKATPGQAGLDLRGVPRPQGGAPDIGAYELDEGQSRRETRVACDSAALSAAITDANRLPGAERLILDAGCTYTLERTSEAGVALPTVRDYLEIAGNSATISPTAGAPPMKLLRAENATLHISDLTLAGALTESSALDFDSLARFGADDDLTLTQVTLRDNRADEGTVYFYGARLRVEASRFERNQGTGYAGALYISSGSAEISESSFHDNRARDGGAIYSGGGTLAIRASTFAGNRADEEGGALYHDGGIGTVEASSFRDNRAAASGGALYFATSQAFTIEGSTFAANSAPNGGALYIESIAGMELENNLWHDHPQASADEAVVWVRSDGETPVGVVIAHNTFGAAAVQPGAAVRRAGAVRLVVSGSIIAAHSEGVGAIQDSALQVTQNLFWQAPLAGEGPTADPRFVAPAAGDYRLREGSPAIDAVENSETTRDLAGTDRPQGEGYDQGAYEYIPGAPEQPGQPAPPAGSSVRVFLPLLRR